MRRWVGFLRTTPCLVLLLVQLGGVVLYPFMAESVAGRAAYSVFGIIVLMLTIVALRVTGHARSVVMLEQVAGIFYIAMVVTRLVSLRADRRRA